jgi:hypothetical protein
VCFHGASITEAVLAGVVAAWLLSTPGHQLYVARVVTPVFCNGADASSHVQNKPKNVQELYVSKYEMMIFDIMSFLYEGYPSYKKRNYFSVDILPMIHVPNAVLDHNATSQQQN